MTKVDIIYFADNICRRRGIGGHKDDEPPPYTWRSLFHPPERSSGHHYLIITQSPSVFISVSRSVGVRWIDRVSERGTEQTKQVVAVSSNLILKVRDHQISLLRGWWVSCVPLIAGTVDNHSANVTGFGLFLLNNNDCQMQLTLCLHHYESVKTSSSEDLWWDIDLKLRGDNLMAFLNVVYLLSYLYYFSECGGSIYFIFH